MPHPITFHRRLCGIRNIWMAVLATSLVLFPSLNALTLSGYPLALNAACRRPHFKRDERMHPTSTTSLSASEGNDNIEAGSPTRPTRRKRYKNRKRKNGKRTTSTSIDKNTPSVTTTAVTATATKTVLSKNGKKYAKNAAAIAVATAATAILQSSSSSSSLDTDSDLSEEELANDVSESFLNGSNGFFKETHAKRQRLEEENEMFGSDPSHTQQLEYLKELDMHPALVLNADYQPLSILPLSLWSWQETIKAVFSGKVTVVDVYPDLNIRAVNMDVPLPSVIALTDYIKQPNQSPAFTRRNVYLRDGYICQYCGKRFMTQDLTLDHVYPRCYGGKLEWTNAVTCCKKCNARKGSTLPTELRRVGMKLLREPRVPSKYELASVAGQMYPRRGAHPTWEPYLGLGMKPKKNVEDSSKFAEDDGREFEF